MLPTEEDKSPYLSFYLFIFLVIDNKFIKQRGFFISFFVNKLGNGNNNLNSNFPLVWAEIGSGWIGFQFSHANCPYTLSPTDSWGPVSVWGPLLCPYLCFLVRAAIYAAMPLLPSPHTPSYKRLGCKTWETAGTAWPQAEDAGSPSKQGGTGP